MLAALKTVHEMLEDRGYVVRPDYELETKNEAKHIRQITTSNLAVVADRDSDEDTVYVFFAFDPKLGVATTRTFLSRMEDDDIDHGILVCAQQPSHKSREELENANVEIFKAFELFKNRSRHALVPKHEVVSDEEVEALVRKYNTTIDKFPGYSKSDPVVRYFHWPAGTMVRIYRRFGAQREPEITYRVVRDGI